MSVNSLLEIIKACQDEDTLFEFLQTTTQDVPIHLSAGTSAGDLRDLLCELTASFSYISSLIANINHIINVFDETIDKHTSIIRESIPQYKSKITKAEKDDKARISKIKDINICGMHYKTTTISDLQDHKTKIVSLLGYYKNILETIEKSISVGITVLSFEKQELKNLGVV